MLTGQVLQLVAIGALHREKAFAVRTPLDILRMNVTILALQGLVPFGMAIHATRMHEDFVRFKKSRS